MSESKTLLNPPRGMRDFYPEDMPLREAIFDAWRSASLAFGFRPYDASVVESLDLLKRKAGEEIVDQIYAFQDKSGRDLALRPEMTPTLARMVAAHQGALSFPLKWYAIAQCFRYERMSRGRKREHYQWNLDVIGEPSVAAEVEVVAAAVRALDLLGCPRGEVCVLYSSRALLTELLLKLGIERARHDAIFLALDKLDKTGEEKMAGLLADAGLEPGPVERIRDLLNVSSLEEAAGLLGHADSPAHTDLCRFAELLEAYDLADVVRFDLSIVRGLAYYTGIVFEAYDPQRKFRAVFGGGRYDNLLREVGGKPATGVGLGFGDVVVAELLGGLGVGAPASASATTAVGYLAEEQRMTAMAVARALRASGARVDLALSPEKAKAFFSRVGKGGFDQAMFIGPDDVAKGTVRVKNLKTREEHEASLTDIGVRPRH